jgi:hypothetical protein
MWDNDIAAPITITTASFVFSKINIPEKKQPFFQAGKITVLNSSVKVYCKPGIFISLSCGWIEHDTIHFLMIEPDCICIASMTV